MTHEAKAMLGGTCDDTLPKPSRKSRIVSGRFREYSRFAETIGGDGFDQDCRPILALIFGPISGLDGMDSRNLPLGLPHDLTRLGNFSAPEQCCGPVDHDRARFDASLRPSADQSKLPKSRCTASISSGPACLL